MNRVKGWGLLALVAVIQMAVQGGAVSAAAWGMTAVGAFVAALPERLRRRKEPRLRSSWQGCAVCFAAGFSMVLAAGLGRMNGRLLTGLAQGSISAWAFGATAWLAALIVCRIRERRRRA